MALEDGVHKDLLEEDYRRYRQIAEQARTEEKPKKASKYYTECASVLDQIAELESSNQLSDERRELAANLRKAASTLSDRGTLKKQDEVPDGNTEPAANSGGGSPGSNGGSGNPGDAGTGPDSGEDEPDPSDYLEDPPEMDFEDVGGMTELKQTLTDKVIDPLERPELYEEYNLGVVNGVLLYGPPGTGKTYISRALAGKLGYNFIEVTTDEITSSLVGEASDNVAELFEVARSSQPCLVFIDEIDGLIPARSGGSQKTQSERQMVNQFLTELTRIRGEDVIVIAATNIPDEVDGAALSRFQERVEVPPPDAVAREAVLRVHLRERPILTEEIQWSQIRDLTDGYSARDLELVASNAARKAVHDAQEAGDIRPITQEHIESAIAETEPSLQHWGEQ